MIYSVNRFLFDVLKRRFDMEAQRWFAALESGFDVAVVVEEPLLLGIIEQYLRTPSERLTHLKFQFINRTARESTDLEHRPIGHNSNQTKVRDNTPSLSLCDRDPPAGLAAIHFQLPTLVNLLPTPAAMVSQILESAKLERYMDAFDGQKMTLLRRMLEQAGPEIFFDGVVQIAYLAGYRGDDNAALQALRSLLERGVEERTHQAQRSEKGRAAALSRADSLGAIFEKFIQLPDPHDVLKAALAHYVLHSRKITQSEASRLLKVSRSTLQAHLQLAERLNVAAFFSQENSPAS